MTKKYRKLSILYSILSIVVTLVPIAIYTIKGFSEGTIGQKFTLGICLLCAMGLVVLNLLFKFTPRCGIWLVLTGLAYACNSITLLLIIMAITTAVDEIILSPLAKKYKGLYTINKEIDKRGS